MNDTSTTVGTSESLKAPAESVKADGVSVGEMQATLLRKIEELTLHVIELDKGLDAVRHENEQLRGELIHCKAGSQPNIGDASNPNR